MGRKEYWRLVDGQGRPPGLMGMWPSRAVTFIENHDTGQPLNHVAAEDRQTFLTSSNAMHGSMGSCM